jgi:hypothetical protein
MIITKSVPYSEIKKQLSKKDKIGIVACNACAKMCKTGGDFGMQKLVSQLKKDGFNVVDQDIIGVACDFDQLKKDELQGDVTIVLACDSGMYNLEKLFPKRRIITGTKTIGIGAYDHKGNITLVKKVCN